MSKILKILTMTGLASALAITNNQLKIDNCPDCENVDDIVSSAINSDTTNADKSNIHLTDNGTNNVDFNVIETYPATDERPVVVHDETDEQNNVDDNYDNNNFANTDNNQESNNDTNIEIGQDTNQDGNLDTNLDKNDNLNQDIKIDNNDTGNSSYTYEDYYACYESLKEKLAEAIECNQKLVASCESCNTLTDEEKDKINTNYLELQQLIDTLEENNNKILCNITGENCHTQIDSAIIDILNLMEQRIVYIQNAIKSMPTVNDQNTSIKYFADPYRNLYGYYYRYCPTTPIVNNDDLKESQGENDNSQSQQNNDENIDNDNSDNNEKSKLKNIDTYAKLRRPSNIDTYGPQYRNIDTFFNTALIDDNMFDYNNENYGGYGNYGMGYMGNPYMFGGKINGYNGSNGGYINQQNNQLQNTEHNPNNNTNNQTTNLNNNINNATIQSQKALKVETDTNDLEDTKRFKFGKNIDTYNEQTMQGNVNTMGGKKVTDYVKDIFKKYFGKKDKEEKVIKNDEIAKNNQDTKNGNQNLENATNQNQENTAIAQNEINDYVDNFIDSNLPQNINKTKQFYSQNDNQKQQTKDLQFDEKNNKNQNLKIDDSLPNNDKDVNQTIVKTQTVQNKNDEQNLEKTTDNQDENFDSTQPFNIKKVDLPILY